LFSPLPFFIIKIMANHVLSLEIPTVTTSTVLKVFDTSVYSPLVSVFNPRIQVLVPGFNNSVEISFVPQSAPSITACDLHLQTEGCGQTYSTLPDGIYKITYIVGTDSVVNVQYSHLRMTCALSQYEKILCDIDVADCDPPASVKEKLRELQLIHMYLQAAKAKIETCHEDQEGMTLFNYAVKLLNKLDCKHC